MLSTFERLQDVRSWQWTAASLSVAQRSVALQHHWHACTKQYTEDVRTERVPVQHALHRIQKAVYGRHCVSIQLCQSCGAGCQAHLKETETTSKLQVVSAPLTVDEFQVDDCKCLPWADVKVELWLNRQAELLHVLAIKAGVLPCKATCAILLQYPVTK